MKNVIKNFSFPYTKQILISSSIMIFLPLLIFGLIDTKSIIDSTPYLFKSFFLISSLLAALGFIYCTLGFHFKTKRGDELKFRIHLESLEFAFTTSLVFFFVFVFIFLNFAPTMLNYILIILVIVGIVAYLIGMEFIKERYE
ncbi:MAG: hypothetical protein KF816_16640 [Melioribacteraceae bacterium]|nr:hypothetical protein [Melioribacteraceae bacterium]